MRQGARTLFRALTLAALPCVAVPLPAWGQASQAQTPETQDATFAHSNHQGVACQTCHTPGTSMLNVGPSWCANCHHENRRPEECLACHQAEDVGPRDAVLRFRLPSGEVTRTAAFSHAVHIDQECGSCHSEAVMTLVEDFSCAQCHEEHHEKDAGCLACHGAPPEWAHQGVVAVHSGCAGGGTCHSRFPGQAEWWRRTVCTACHTDFSEDEPLPDRPTGLVHGQPVANDTTANSEIHP